MDLKHEILFRSEDTIANRSKMKVLVLGLGALGSNLIPLLARNGFENITGLDFDRVDSHNPANQFFNNQDVGRKKAAVMRARMQREFGVRIDVVDQRVERVNRNQFRSFDLIIDTFDNWEARGHIKTVCEELGISDHLVHAGMSDQGYFEIRWDYAYHVPKVEVEQEDVCDYPLACNLVYLTVAHLAEVVCRFADERIQDNVAFTLKDLNAQITLSRGLPPR